jgi:IS6 family transposase
VILLAVGWYLRFSLSYRDVEELLAERGLHADHVTVWRMGPAVRARIAAVLTPPPSTSFSEPSRTRPRLSAFRAKALGGANHPAPRVINTDGHAAYLPAVAQLKAEGALAEDCRHRPVPYLNNVLEQDHRAIKRRIRASQHFRSFWRAWRTMAGYARCS